jgi:GT2 family glycosyltransferase
MEKIKLAIIILNKSNNKLLFDCISSILEKTQFKNYHIYIGDTGSTDDEKERIKNFILDKPITLLEYDYYNFGKCNNDIIKRHIKDETLLCFCNNDIKLIDDCITSGVKMYSRNTCSVGTIGFKLLFENNTIQHAGQLLVVNGNEFAAITHLGLHKNKDMFSDRNIVIGNTAALMMTPRKLFNDIGGFNESYLECFEDVEYNLMCIIKNKYNIYIGDKTAYHYESKTRNNNSNKIQKLQIDASERLIPFFKSNLNKIIESGLTLNILK